MAWDKIEHFFYKLISEKNGNIKKGLIFKDNLGFIISKEDGLEIIEKLNIVYNSKGIENWIEKKNIETDFQQYSFPYDKENDIYLLKKPTYVPKMPRFNAGESWSFTCEWCGNRWSNKEKDYYYRVNFRQIELNEMDATVCSEECAKHITFHIQKNWIHKHGFDKFFKKNIISDEGE